MRDSDSAAVSLLVLCSVGCAFAESAPQNFVRLADLAPGIVQDIRYATSENFTGRPVPGYRSPACWLRREVAEALAAVQKDAASEGLTLVVYDCFRPRRATKAFVAWAEDEKDQAMKTSYYPRVDKRDLFALGYISKASAHSTGTAVDIGIVGLDFGTPFDLFDEKSATRSASVGTEAKRNREKLVALMARHGFENLPQEWWHFSLPRVENADPRDFEVE